jgi:glycine oxidase
MTEERILIVGAGVIGLSLALRLRERGYGVEVLEAAGVGARREGQASWAAAGMLAVHDVHHPAGLVEFAAWSGDLYENYLQRVQAAAGLAVPYQTQMAVEYVEGTARWIEERSIDPRQLMLALEAAVLAEGVEVRRDARVVHVRESGSGVELELASGELCVASRVVFAGGAWGAELVRPRKGQMLRVRLPDGFVLEQVHRSEEVYVVPRLYGPQAGTALIGATVEDVGFDTRVEEDVLRELRARGAKLVPELGDAREAPMVEAWAGLRPGTEDGLPVMGAVPGMSRQFVASGHFRNGILLAPATAEAMVDLLEDRARVVDMSALAPRSIAHAGR